MKSYVLIVLILLVWFIFDLMIPLGFAGGMGYVIPIVLSLKFNDPEVVVAVVMAATVLTLIGWTISATAGIPAFFVTANRLVAIILHHIIGHLMIRTIKLQQEKDALLVDIIDRSKELDTLKLSISSVKMDDTNSQNAIEILDRCKGSIDQLSFLINNPPQ